MPPMALDQDAETDPDPLLLKQLSNLEKQFAFAEREVQRRREELFSPLYERRHNLISKIKDFWPLVFEHAPDEFDSYIRPSDPAILFSSLVDLKVERHVGEKSEPSMVRFIFEFKQNEWFEDKKVEKEFWYVRSKSGWEGWVSTPVGIKWKSKKKDPTGGLLDAAVKLWTEEGVLRTDEGKTSMGAVSRKSLWAYQKLLEKLGDDQADEPSFFAWFGFRGRDVRTSESVEAMDRERARLERIEKGEEVADSNDEAEDDEEDDDDGLAEFEIFPDGEELAIAIAEDLWPNALKYFCQAHVVKSVIPDFEDDDDGPTGDLDEDDDVDERPRKKIKK